MLERVVHENGVVTYQSAKLRATGLVHAFTTRLGGVSRGPYASLNLGTLAKGTDGDANTSVAANYRRLRQALGCTKMPRLEVRQIHGGEVWLPGHGDLVRPAEAPCADAIVADRTNAMLTIRVADCVPLLLTDDAGGVIAAVHAGWRGVIAQVVTRTVQRLTDRLAIPARRLVAAIGPCISVEHFEVGPEVAEQFERAGLSQTVQHDRGPKPHVDLRNAVRLQLLAAGLSDASIDTTDRCTHRDADEFYSHRRDHGQTGRLAAVIARRG